MIRTLTALILLLLPAGFAAAAEIRCARVDSNAVIHDYREFEDTCPPDIPHKDVIWLPAPVAEQPAFDAATQVLEGMTVTIGENAVTQEYIVRDKTAQELADEANSKKEGVLMPLQFVLRRLCDLEYRLRVLEGKQVPAEPDVSWEQCRQAIKDSLQ